MSTKLFIGGLSFKTTNDTLQRAFEKYGDVVEAKVVYERDSDRSRGFGFVTYAKPEDAEAAVAGMSGQDLDGRQIRVDTAKEGGPRGGGGGDRDGGRGYGGGSRGGGRSYGGGGGRDYDRGSYGDRDRDSRRSDDRDDRRSGGGYDRRESSGRRAPYEVEDSRSGGYSRSSDRGRERDRDDRDD